MLPEDVNHAYDVRGRHVAQYEMLVSSPTHMNPFASHQLIYDGGRVILERVFAEIPDAGLVPQPVFEDDVYGGLPTGRWLGMTSSQMQLDTFTLSNPTSTLQQIKAWGHGLEWYAHDGDLAAKSAHSPTSWLM